MSFQTLHQLLWNTMCLHVYNVVSYNGNELGLGLLKP